MNGMNDSVLNEWLNDISACEPTVCSEDVTKEARENLWCFSLSAENSKRISKEELSRFVRAVANMKAQQLDRPMTFYCWFDEQACQLRISLASVTQENLPFGCHVVHTEDLDEITGAFLDSDLHDGIPCEEFREITENLKEHGNERDFELKVWSIEIGGHQRQ